MTKIKNQKFALLLKENQPDYTYLLDIDWNSQVQYVQVELTERTNGAGLRKTITYKVRPYDNKQTLTEALMKEGILKDRVDVNKQVKDRLQEKMKYFVENKLGTYEKAVRIYNDLVRLKVKDKRTYSCGETYEGAIQYKEIESNMSNEFKTPEKYEHWAEAKSIDEFPIELSFPCHYDYDYSKKGDFKYIYDAKKCIVKEGTYDLKLKITFNPYLDPTRTLMIPTPSIFYVMVDSKNQKQSINLISNCNESHKYEWKKQANVYKRLYRSSAIIREWREVTLNTFILYCREKNDSNKSMYMQDVKEKANEDEMLGQVVRQFGKENVTKCEAYKSDVNFNANAHWGRYSTPALKVSLKDGSYMLYDYRDMTRYKKLSLLGIYDSTYTKEKTDDAFKRVMETNEVDKALIYDMMDMIFETEDND